MGVLNANSLPTAPPGFGKGLIGNEGCPWADGVFASFASVANFDFHCAFDPNDVEPWPTTGRFEVIKKLMDASRNKGEVHLMRDTQDGKFAALKIMPNTWMKKSHKQFMVEHPNEMERPWQDLGAMRFLDRFQFPYMCSLQGVYRDQENTYVMTSLASEGDLFEWASKCGLEPGPERELAVWPLAVQLARAIQRLHELSLVHRDISAENVVLSKNKDGTLSVKIIDFGMASTSRWGFLTPGGKASYQAPEQHALALYDAYLADTFAFGVTLWVLLFAELPWQSTAPGKCRCFDHVKKHGLRAYFQKRRKGPKTIDAITSEPLKRLLEGVLAVDPTQRLTLGERNAWSPYNSEKNTRRSVWDQPWLYAGPPDVVLEF